MNYRLQTNRIQVGEMKYLRRIMENVTLRDKIRSEVIKPGSQVSIEQNYSTDSSLYSTKIFNVI